MLKVRLQQNHPVQLDVSFQCQSGQLMALVGPSGSGKTTVLRTIAGLHKVEQGRIECQQQTWFDSNNNSCWTPQQRHVGMVFQNYALFPHLTVNDNIRIACNGNGKAQQRVNSLLEQVHLTGLGHRYPSQLSGGQQQRVALARALARQPKVLLLDEPFSAVDKVTRRKLYLELHALRRNLSMPIILVTHDLDEAAMLADSMCVIHQGKTLQQGEPIEVLCKPDNIAVAQQIDVRNLFDGQICEHQGKIKLRWHDYLLEITETANFPVGSSVHWTISPVKVLLHQRVRPSHGEHENPLTGIVREMITLKGITTVLISIEGLGDNMLQMDVPEHVVSRNQLQLGESISVSILSEAIHVMPADVDGNF